MKKKPISKIIKKGIRLGNKIIPKKSKAKVKLGLAPGSLVFTGERKMAEVEISVIQHLKEQYSESNPKNSAEVIDLVKDFKGITWINVEGLHDEKIIEEICTFFGIHKLTMEDILSVGQRPKLEEHGEYLHVVLKMLMVGDEETKVSYEQLSFIKKGNVLITFQEKKGDVFDGVRRRLKEGKGIRNRSADYVMYALMDAVVDYYFVILEVFGEQLEEVESFLLENPDKSTLNRLHLLRRETLNIRRSIYPLREVVSSFEKIEEPMVAKEVKVFIRDLYDHTIQVIDTVEVFREIASGLLDLYMNSVSNKMNEVMKVLTIIATIFIPLTFIVGVYGMNFDNIPELHFQNGYFIVWGLMVFLFVGMLFYFKNKKWF